MDGDGGSTTPTVTIAIVAWRESAYLQRCLDALAANVPADLFRTILILNEATDSARARVRPGGPVTEVLAFRNNLGFGAAANVAVERAATEFVVLLNDDCVVQPGWLQELIGTARRRPAAGAVGSLFLNLDGSLQEAGSVLWADAATVPIGGDAREDGQRWRFERRVDYCSGASLLIRTEAWRAVGGIDERYYPGYYEDVDLSLRLAELGYETWLSPLSVVLHTKGGSSTERYRTFLGRRNAAVFAQRWADAPSRLPATDAVENAVWRAMGQPRRVLVLADLDPDGVEAAAELTAMLGQAGADDDAFVTVCGRVPAACGDELARRGVRVVEDLPAHLADPAVDFDTVVLAREGCDGVRDLLGERIGATDTVVLGSSPSAAR